MALQSRRTLELSYEGSNELRLHKQAMTWKVRLHGECMP